MSCYVLLMSATKYLNITLHSYLLMLDIKFIRENADLVKENLKKKFRSVKLVDEVLALDEKLREFMKSSQELRAQRNSISKSIADAKKAGKDPKEFFKLAKSIPQEIARIEDEQKIIEEEFMSKLKKIPNMMHESVPIGKDDSDNVEIERIGEPKIPDYEVLHHADIAESLGGVDFDSSRNTSGHGFYFLTGDLAMLHSAILNYARDYMVQNGFSHTIPPFMIRRAVVEGVMSFAEMDSMMYKIENEDLYLIGTSEHSMIGRFIDSVIDEKKLPLALTSYSPCFRKEVGAHGLEERGLYRLHQFEKQEMIVICKPEESYKWYDKMLNLSVGFFKSLNIPVRKLECCSGDLADLKAKSADVEAWSPRQKKYFEVGSCSNLTEAQARRLRIRIDSGKERYYAHTLNNTVVASPRALIALLENNQQKDGSVKIPTALQPYMLGKKKISPEN